MRTMELEYKFPESEFYDESKSRFITLPPVKLHFEHSLYTISKWESITKKPFFPKSKEDTMTDEEMLIYIKCSVIEDLDDENEILYRLDKDFIEKFKGFIGDTKTATWFNDHRQTNKLGNPNKEVVTSELMYYYMVAMEIPFECEHWFINRLVSLIRICSIKQNNDPMSKKDEAMSRSQLNKLRKAQMAAKKMR